MGKWVAAAAVALLVILFFLWRSLDEPPVVVVAQTKKVELVKTAPSVELAMAEAAAKEKAGEEARAAGKTEVMDAGSIG